MSTNNRVCATKTGEGTMRLKAAIILPFAIGAGLYSASAKADDAPWGCQIILCAASQSPSWHGVPYCVPPMRKLITAMAEPGFSWPICPNAGTGKPGFERYDDCPDGYSPTRDANDDHSSALSKCIARDIRCRETRDGNDRCSARRIIDRPKRSEPWYFDIPQTGGGTARVWFDLNE